MPKSKIEQEREVRDALLSTMAQTHQEESTAAMLVVAAVLMKKMGHDLVRFEPGEIQKLGTEHRVRIVETDGYTAFVLEPNTYVQRVR